MILSLNRLLQKWMALLTPTALIGGVLFDSVGHALLFCVPWLLAFMMFSGSVTMRFSSFRIFVQHPFVVVMSLLLLHVAMPIVAYWLAQLFFDDALLTLGFVLSVAVPTGISSFIWLSMSRGNTALGLAIILIDTMLSPLIIPAMLHIVFGRTVELDTKGLMLDLVLMVVVPALLAMGLNESTHGQVGPKLGSMLAPFSKLSILSIVFINSSVVAPYLKHLSSQIVAIIGVVLLLIVCSYVLNLGVGHAVWRHSSIVPTFLFTGGMRNIAVGVVLATSYFPGKTVMPVVFGMLFQQMLASVVSKLMERYEVKETSVATS